MDKTNMAIFVAGIGAYTPIGKTAAENWRAVLEKKTAVAPIERFDTGGIACTKAGLAEG